jgi:hypothetical protein
LGLRRETAIGPFLDKLQQLSNGHLAVPGEFDIGKGEPREVGWRLVEQIAALAFASGYILEVHQESERFNSFGQPDIVRHIGLARLKDVLRDAQLIAQFVKPQAKLPSWLVHASNDIFDKAIDIEGKTLVPKNV